MTTQPKRDDRTLLVKGMAKSYGAHRVLAGLDLHVEPGEFVCIVGPSGPGKTTLLRCLSGLIRPTTGSVHLGDIQVTGPLADIDLGPDRDQITTRALPRFAELRSRVLQEIRAPRSGAPKQSDAA